MREQYPKNWERILEVGNLAPPLTLRVNLSRTSRAELAKSWTEKGLASTEQGEQGLVLSHPLHVHDIPGFDAGLC